MPPLAAVAGDQVGPAGRRIKIAPLSDEDRLTLMRWIDLGCPIDLDHDASRSESAGVGWMLDDQRPTLTLTLPRAGANPPMSRILVGMYDSGGLAMDSFRVVASFPVAGAAPGKDLARKFCPLSSGEWELKLDAPITVARGTLTVSASDRQGNESRIERPFSAARDDRR